MTEVKSERLFDAYDFSAVVVPGAMLMIIALLLHPLPGFSLEKIDIGGFGVFAVAAFCAGHVLQAVGNVFERIYWSARGGMPTERALEDESLLNRVNREKVLERLRHDGYDVENCTRKKWARLTAHLIFSTRGNGEGHLHKLNANYGLLRGIATAFILAAFIAAGLHRFDVAAALLSLTVITCYRMESFARLYARELFQQFVKPHIAVVKSAYARRKGD
jgi:hypothetical protein